MNGETFSLACAALAAAPRASGLQAQAGAAGGCARRRVAAVSRLAVAHRHFVDHDRAGAEAGVGLGRRRSVRFVAGDRRRRGLRRHRHRRAGRGRPGRRQAALALQGRRSRSANRRRRWPTAASSSAISIGVVHAVNVADGKPVWTFKTQSEIKSSPVVVGDLVLIGSYDGNALRPRRRRRQAALDRTRPRTTCTARRAIVDGVAYFAGCDEMFHAVDVQDGQGALRHLGHRLHRRVGGARRQRRLLRHVRQPGARARSRTRARCCGATSIPIASFRSIRRRRWSTARWCSAAAIAWCTRSTRRPARRAGPT